MLSLNSTYIYTHTCITHSFCNLLSSQQQFSPTSMLNYIKNCCASSPFSLVDCLLSCHFIMNLARNFVNLSSFVQHWGAIQCCTQLMQHYQSATALIVRRRWNTSVYLPVREHRIMAKVTLKWEKKDLIYCNWWTQGSCQFIK